VLTRPAPAPGLVEEDLDNDVCLYRPDIDEVLVLNQSAGDVWRLADGTMTASEIVLRLAAAYSAEPKAIATEVQQVLSDLQVRGYLVEGSI
jgi:hypothetical protein